MTSIVISKTILVAASVVIGLVLFVMAYNAAQLLFLTECHRSTINELEELKGKADKCVGRSELTLRSACIKRVEAGDYVACEKICNEVIEEKEWLFASGDSGTVREERQECLQGCSICNKEGVHCMIGVPKIPSSWNYLKFWEFFNTYRARDALAFVEYSRNTISLQGGRNNSLASPEDGTRTYCISTQPAGQDSCSLRATPGECNEG